MKRLFHCRDRLRVSYTTRCLSNRLEKNAKLIAIYRLAFKGKLAIALHFINSYNKGENKIEDQLSAKTNKGNLLISLNQEKIIYYQPPYIDSYLFSCIENYNIINVLMGCDGGKEDNTAVL